MAKIEIKYPFSSAVIVNPPDNGLLFQDLTVNPNEYYFLTDDGGEYLTEVTI